MPRACAKSASLRMPYSSMSIFCGSKLTRSTPRACRCCMPASRSTPNEPTVDSGCSPKGGWWSRTTRRSAPRSRAACAPSSAPRGRPSGAATCRWSAPPRIGWSSARAPCRRSSGCSSRSTRRSDTDPWLKRTPSRGAALGGSTRGGEGKKRILSALLGDRDR
eukprot:scaffold85332_cov57-Phaeocystis_antarctica.AAC.1